MIAPPPAPDTTGSVPVQQSVGTLPAHNQHLNCFGPKWVIVLSNTCKCCQVCFLHFTFKHSSDKCSELLFAFFPPVIHAMYAMRGNTASSPFTALWISSQIRGFHTVWCRFRVRCNVFTGCWSRLTARSPFQLQQDIFCSLTADQVVSASQLKNWTVFCTDLFTGLENFSDLDEYETSESKLWRTVSCLSDIQVTL